MKVLFLCVVVALFGSGCANLTPDPQYNKVTKFGPQSVLMQPVEEPDLISLISEGDMSFPVDASADSQKFSMALDQATRRSTRSGRATSRASTATASRTG